MREMRGMFLIAFLCLFFVSIATPAGAQTSEEPAEPSKEQTIDYLLERTDDVSLKTSTMSIRTESKLIKLNVSHVQNATIADCILTIKETKKENEDLVLEKILSVPIAKLNPTSIKIDADRLIIFTSDDGLDVDLNAKYRKDARGEWTNDKRSVDAIIVNYSKGQGEKLSRAFSHLIKLCGGQEDLF